MTHKILITTLITLMVTIGHSVAADTKPTLAVGNVHQFLPAGSVAVHIGDDAGRMDDVNAYKRRHHTTYGGWKHSWSFLVNQETRDAVLTISMFSLSSADAHNSCETTAYINGESVGDLRDETSGTGNTTIRRLIVPGNFLRLGENELTIEEEMCSGSMAANDSVILPESDEIPGVSILLR